MKLHTTLLIAFLILGAASIPRAAKGEQTDSSTTALSKAVFERLKKFEGRWVGQSTKGWTDTLTYKTVAGGSVVVEESFGAHPNETMYTMFHLDGHRLLLTHYCVAHNQPRLVATEFADTDSGQVAVFSFLDITGVPSRDNGHMDKCRLTLVDDNHTKMQWTWYQDGKESWMEDILQKRVE